MTRFSASVATTGFSLLLIAAAIPLQTRAQNPVQDSAQTPASAPDQIQTQTSQPYQPTATVSKVRIVRISEISGTVQLDRSNGHGFEQAIPNLPVVEQNRLKTANGVAEVEFEDNSSLRLGPNSEVQFTELGRTDAGATVSSVRVLSGMAYVSLVKQSNNKAPANQFELAFGDRKIPLQPGTHVRLEMTDKEAKLSAIDGSLHVDTPEGALEIPRKKTATFALADQAEPVIAKSEGNELLDTWDKQSAQRHEHVASLAAFGNTPYSYGLSDMMYYGSFADLGGGCGMMWRPYFTSAAWDPYSSGVWAYYANTGYSWVSPYPWGWTPYHYGSWSFCPGAGWGWSPGGAWNGLNNMTSSLHRLDTTPTGPTGPRGKGGPTLPVAPPHPPRTGESSLLAHNLTALVHSGAVPNGPDGEGSFVFRKDSAGLGIPRNELGNLHGFSQRVGQKGGAATPIYVSGGMNAAAPGSISRSGFNSSYAPVSVHRGSSSFGSYASSSSHVSSSSSFSSMHASSTMSAPSSVSSAGGGASHH